jgi:hypothetical protein
MFIWGSQESRLSIPANLDAHWSAGLAALLNGFELTVDIRGSLGSGRTRSSMGKAGLR